MKQSTDFTNWSDTDLEDEIYLLNGLYKHAGTEERSQLWQRFQDVRTEQKLRSLHTDLNNG